MFEYFHFLRVEYLALLIPIWLLIFWLLKAQDDTKVFKGVIDPELLPFLIEKPKRKTLKAPVLLGIVLSLMLLALSGPAYKLSNSGGKQERSEIVFVLNVTKSMQSSDLMPQRFSRAILKMDDFLSKNSDMKTALVAYNGSAHLVMPLIQDKSIISRFAASLSPEIMPLKGDALYDALTLASKQFVKVDGTIVVITDGLSQAEVKKVKEDKTLKNYKIIVYNITSKALQKANTQNLSAQMNADFVAFSIKEDDIASIENLISHQYENAQMKKEGSYIDSGYELLPLILILLLFFFRRGFIAELWSVR